MPAIRIAQVVEAAEGGCKRHVLGLLAGLDPERFRQTAIVSPWRERGTAEEIASATGGAAGVIEWDVRREARPGPDYAAYRFLQDLFRQRDFDVIHCHSAKAGFLGRLAARGLRASVLYTPHCLPFMMRTLVPWQIAYLWMERLAGRFTDRLIAVSPSEAEIAARLHVIPAERIVTIENGIDPDSVRVPVDVSRKKAELQIGADDRVVLSVGGLRAQKGYRYLVQAAPEVLEAHPNTVFPIAGEGELRPMLEAQVRKSAVADRVRLLGHRADVPELLAIADCFVIPSLWEGGPYALLEAMAAGVPVVGSAIPGILDWVRDGETGYRARPANAASLAEALVAALSPGAEGQWRAHAAREMVVRRNTQERWLRQMTELYGTVGGEAQQRPSEAQ
jgi:glycosyltransferase involved in cell wall biosynthesis